VTDGDALLRAILADPSDETLRLVYADWLDENGEVDRAALVRVQIELDRFASDELVVSEQRLLGPVGDRVCQRRRDWALPECVLKEWPHDVGGWDWRCGFPEVWHCPLALWEAHGPALVSARPVRGVALIDRQPASFMSNPRAPRWTWFRDDSGWAQRPGDDCLLPPALFELLEPHAFDFAMFDHSRTYPSRDDALSALSDACLNNARLQAR
jgi:uncharacterized protein (TIGR02996 family)